MNNKKIEDFFQGKSVCAHEIFGSKAGKDGVTFTVYAPLARSVQVKGDFNDWQGERNWLTKVDERGIWTTTVPQAKEYQLYKYEIETKEGQWVEKADPYARYSELRPNWASIVVNGDNYPWSDEEWMKNRSIGYDRPVNVYEVYAGGWKRDQFGNWYTYRQLKEELIPYVKEHGYTHIEFMPLMNNPFDGSWGYQIAGFFALTSRYGTVYEFQDLVNEAHKQGIGIIMDFVAVHFTNDGYALSRFDGSPVYEYSDSNEHSQWGSYNFDLGKDPVRSFLMSAAEYWVGSYHLDGLRMDAVSNMIYYDGNKNHGVNEGGVEFIQRLNQHMAKDYPQVMMIAEDSSDYPKVTAPVRDGGLGFDYKWDMGWMNDTLNYYKRDPVFRKYHHNDLTFSMMYYWSEKFVLPLSHDEVVHGKATIVNKMWGLYEDKFAQNRNLVVYQMTHPGKKLNFMGNEIGHFREFDENKQLDWFLLDYPMHQGFARAVTDMNQLYLAHPAFWQQDYANDGFHWIDPDNGDQSVYSYYRQDDKEIAVVVLNMTPVDYPEFHIGVPQRGWYSEIYNTDKSEYGGKDRVNQKPVIAHKEEFREFPYTIHFHLAPFAGIIFLHKKTAAHAPKKVK